MSFDAFFSADPNAVGGDNTEPPDPGMYEAALIDAGVFVAKSNGRTTLKMEWKVVSAVNAGHEWTAIQQIRDGEQQSANFFKRACVDLGVNVDAIRSIDDLDMGVREKIGGYYTLEVKQKGDFRNTYITGIASGGPIAPDFAPALAPNDPVTVPDDDAPAEW